MVAGVRDDQLTDPTPCAGTSVAALLDHLDGLTVAFRMAAEKTPLAGGPSADADHLAGRLADPAAPAARRPGRRLAATGGVGGDGRGGRGADAGAGRGGRRAQRGDGARLGPRRRHRPAVPPRPRGRAGVPGDGGRPQRSRERVPRGCSGRSCRCRTTPRCSTGCWVRPAAIPAGRPPELWVHAGLAPRAPAGRSDRLGYAEMGEGEVELGDLGEPPPRLLLELLRASAWPCSSARSIACRLS